MHLKDFGGTDPISSMWAEQSISVNSLHFIRCKCDVLYTFTVDGCMRLNGHMHTLSKYILSILP